MDFQPLDISKLSKIEATFGTAEEAETYSVILLAKFVGQASNSHHSCYRHIEVMMAGNMVAAVPDAVILDFSELEYEWGDEMGGVLFYCSNHPIETCVRIPVAVVTSELNRDGLTSLVRDEMHQPLEEWLVDSVEDAIALIVRLRRQLISAAKTGKLDPFNRWFAQEPLN